MPEKEMIYRNKGRGHKLWMECKGKLAPAICKRGKWMVYGTARADYDPELFEEYMFVGPIGQE